VSSRPAQESLTFMAESEVTASRIYDARDIVEDPTYIERGDVIEIEDADLGTVRMQAALPKMANHGGTVWRTGAALGADNDEIYGSILGLDTEEIQRLKDQKII
jgi:crotonobetainyl-CoA:carnitine CoA-transferase CaiB-like acyl-CoA transferase